ncbi:MAG: NUDIX hydrolase [Planctomycetaceae bacterium]|nr:NUDIX hydrolase [Planctomycetaceae bacterium]
MESLYRGRFLELVRDGHWEYTRRCQSRAVVCAIAVTETDHVLLVEQYRPPVRQRVLELPAGLVGDEADREAEPDLHAIQRELLEETGFLSSDWKFRGEYVSSAGLTNETTVFYEARNCRRAGTGGGVAGENIQIHEIPRQHAPSWLTERIQSGKLLDAKIWAGLWFLDH